MNKCQESHPLHLLQYEIPQIYRIRIRIPAQARIRRKTIWLFPKRKTKNQAMDTISFILMKKMMKAKVEHKKQLHTHAHEIKCCFSHLSYLYY